MLRYKSPAAVTRVVRRWRQQGHRIALVPTMGNLHHGHISLLRHARKAGTKVIASIYVNPVQFNSMADFKNYPRSMRQDIQQLDSTGTDMIFTPGDRQMFPQGMRQQTKVHVPELSEILCGKFRPGHFVGVTSVVARLFGICSPDVAVFGEKDYQQLLLIKRMCQDLNLPVRVISGKTIRCSDGLAMSSRNNLLSERQRATAALLYTVLRQTANAVADNISGYRALQQKARRKLRLAGFKVEYMQVLKQQNLRTPHDNSQRLRVFAAAWLGRVRLIDNVIVPRR